MNAEIILKSLELVAERCEDPSPLVYKRLFERHPELEVLFVLDRTGDVRGHMLFEAIECVINHAETRSFSTSFILSELHNHDGIGVPQDVFPNFFSILMETFREILGPDWTPEFTAAWAALIADIEALVAAHRTGVAA